MKKIEIGTKLSLNKQTITSLQNLDDINSMRYTSGYTICGPGTVGGGTGSFIVCVPSVFCKTNQCHSQGLLCTGALTGCPTRCK